MNDCICTTTWLVRSHWYERNQQWSHDQLSWQDFLRIRYSKILVSEKTTNFLRTKGIEPKRVLLYVQTKMLGRAVRSFDRWKIERGRTIPLEHRQNHWKSLVRSSKYDAFDDIGISLRSNVQSEDERWTDPSPSRIPGDPGKKIDRERVPQRQEYMKKNIESQKSPFEWNIQVDDWVRILKSDCWYREYEEVTNIGQSSVTLEGGDTCLCSESAPRQVRPSSIKGTGYNMVGTLSWREENERHAETKE